MSIEDLCQHWLRSHEEERDDSIQIYRPTGTSLPARRFRMAYRFHSDGRWEWLKLAPDCRHYFTAGAWRLETGASLTPEGTRQTHMLYLRGSSPTARTSRLGSADGLGGFTGGDPDSSEAAYLLVRLTPNQLCLRPVIFD